MKHILLTTDFSDESKRAFTKTADFARRMQLGITLTHVVVDLLATPHGAALAPLQSDPGLPERVAKANEKLEALAVDFDGVTVATQVLTGEHVAPTVADYARSEDTEFIALSTHGSSGLRHLFLGSVAEDMLQHASVPVLAFPPEKA